MAYVPKQAAAAARRAELARLVRDGCANLRKGIMPNDAQAEAIRNAYRTACRAVRSGVRSDNTARQLAVKCQIEDARAAYTAAATARLQAVQPGAVAPAPQPPSDIDPFTGFPMTQNAQPQNFVL